MINKTEARNGKNRRVKYSGNNRPWLSNDEADVRLTGAVSDFSNSVQVRYKDASGTFDTAWAGVGALTFVNEDFADAINSLKVKLELARADVIRYENAIKTLEDL